MMHSEGSNEYTELFLTEALENYTEINNLLTILEKHPKDTRTIHALFRITHTLKGNAAGMGFEKIADLTHTLEDFFAEVRAQKFSLEPEYFSPLYKGVDTLGQLIDSVKTGKEVKYLGIKTKLEVMVRENRAITSDNNIQIDEAMTASDWDDDVSVNVNLSDLVHVPVKKLDNLLNLVGELVIERDRIISTSTTKTAGEYTRLNRISSDLQYSVMDIRLVQVGFLFNKFFRVVRDASTLENKKVCLKLEGTETEIDRNILHAISDSLIHLIRNGVGHGIEDPQTRKQLGKPEEGTITLSARSESETVVIRIKDDGVGIDPERVRLKAIQNGMPGASEMNSSDLINLIFAAGFSTVDQVTAISGRGVGMDVVRRCVDSIGGSVQVESTPGEGTTFTLMLPSSMAVKSTLLCQVESQTYAIPLLYTDSVISLLCSDIHQTSKGLIAVHQGKTIQVVFLSKLFFIKGRTNDPKASPLQTLSGNTKVEIVVVSIKGRKVGLVVDKLLQQKEIVERPLFKPVDSIGFLSGFTILGNGMVCLSLNIPGLLNQLLPNNSQSLMPTI